MAETDPWKNPSEEEEADDLFIEEGDDDEVKGKKKQAQEEMEKEGMLLVSGSEWKEAVKETLTEACKNKETASTVKSNDTIMENIEKVSKATCLVVRRSNGKGRLKHLEEIGDHERLEKAKNGKRGGGTGFLMFPKSPFGWLVITNNHVIMDDEEAKSAEVIFDHLYDHSTDQTKTFKVKQLVSSNIRTKNAQDETSLDFSVLALESDATEKEYLEDCALGFEETTRVNAGAVEEMLKARGLKFNPIIAFSHPHGLGKRLSILKNYPEDCGKYPIAHIKHKLPTRRGSSGANLICAEVGSDPQKLFVNWLAAFVHYRHGHAVAWQAIGPAVREDLSKLK